MSQISSILLCDDEDDLREIFSFDLISAGFAVIQASGGHEAIRLLAQNSVDAILTDLRMPAGSGLDILAHVRTTLESDIPVVLLSGNGDANLPNYLALGANAIFGKPFDRNQMIQALRRLMIPRQTRWQNQRDSAPNSKILAATGVEVAFGTGGFAARLPPQMVQQGPVHFHVELQNFPQQVLKGEGEILWICGEQDTVVVGVEVMSLAIETFDEIFLHFKNTGTCAYIPSMKCT